MNKYTILCLSAIAAFLYQLNCTAKAPKDAIEIIPCPRSIVQTEGRFILKNTAFNFDSSLGHQAERAVEEFVSDLLLVSGRSCTFASPVGITASAEKGIIKGVVFLKDSSLPAENYTIDINKTFVCVKAPDFGGVFYAIQTLKQLFPKEIYGKSTDQSAAWSLPCCRIEDGPRFGYRGMHLDCSRHFFSVEEVKKYLDIMAVFKLNRFHWHLTDDQGWRIESELYPLLTETGAWRDGTMIGKDFESNDGKLYGGFYTKEQLREVVAYASDRNIMIIPEIDLPGHMQAALASYPELGCEGSAPYAVWTKWGISSQVLSVGKESTMQFLEDITGEVAGIFPGEYFHIGGDECPKDEWKTDPHCQAKIAELGLMSDSVCTAEQRLQNYVTARLQKHLAGKGKKIIGWDEILEGDLQEGAIVMSWRGTRGGILAASKGFDVIMTPNEYCYLDYLQSPDPKDEPLGIGGFVDIRKIYSFDPLAGMDAESSGHVLGVQANLWTEYISDPSHLEYMLLPRMIALSEVQWCAPEKKDFDRFFRILSGKEYGILDIMGYNYKRYTE